MNASCFPLIAAGALACLGAGCLGLSPKPDPTRYFVLGTLPPPAAPNPRPVSVAVRRVAVPAYLEKRWLATREGHQIHYAADDEWAEDLAQGIRRVLAANLAALLGPVPIPASDTPPAPAFELLVCIEQFEVDTTGQAVLAAQWEISGANSTAPLRAGQFRQTRQDPAAAADPSAAVQLQSDLLAELSRTLAPILRALGP
ncbi:MAG: membrane integrity-associated transporter subunit PqiC [Verrucomicrobia bacterium]|nr:membrane integrity-associated transporter subunit PqiC [Verrucomicrobiota bacterium]